MTGIQIFWLLIGVLWAVTELSMAISTHRNKTFNGNIERASEKLIWTVICLSLVAALVVKNMYLWPVPLSLMSKQLIGFTLLISGLALRLSAVLCLGSFFSTRVSIQHSHCLIRTGPYRYVRHPSYSGLICSFLGAGLAMGDYLSILVLIVPLVFVLIKRINIEEPYLQNHFEKEYLQYSRTTKKLFPGIY